MAAREDFRQIGRWLDAAATPRRILWTGWLLFVVYCYPGYMSTDSVDQLLQARGEQEIHDWYPPIMALIWRWTDRVIAGPFPMLIIQSVSFLLGLSVILESLMRPRSAAIAASLVLIWPPVLAPMAVIWKDSQMAGFLLAGIACLLSDDKRWKVAGCAFLCLATAQRYNAPAATLPIVLFLFVWKPGLTRLRRYGLALGVFVLITVVAFGANRALTEKKTYAWHGSVALLDIIGMIRFTPSMTDDEVRAKLPGITIVPTDDIHGKMRRLYSPRGWFQLVNGGGRVIESPKTEADRTAVTEVWKTLLSDRPYAYFRHRFYVMWNLLGLSDNKVGVEWDGFTESPAQEPMIQHSAKHSQVQAAWLSIIPKVETSLICRVWAYCLIALVLLPFCRGNRLAFVLFASGLAYESSLFVAAPSADFRYSHWLIVCAIAGALLVFVARWRRGVTTPPGR
jgi:hypothetical protein